MQYLVNTAENRLKFYKALLKEVCNDHRVIFGFCHYINAMSFNKFDISDLPELHTIKPPHKDLYGYWFPNTKKGWETRISKLAEVIDQMEKGKLNVYFEFNSSYELSMASEPLYIGNGHAPEELRKKCLIVSPRYKMDVNEHNGKTILTFIKK
jgi:hypothetical protein